MYYVCDSISVILDPCNPLDGLTQFGGEWIQRWLKQGGTGTKRPKRLVEETRDGGLAMATAEQNPKVKHGESYNEEEMHSTAEKMKSDGFGRQIGEFQW